MLPAGRRSCSRRGESITFVVNLRGTTTTGGLHEVRLGLGGLEAGSPTDACCRLYTLPARTPTSVADGPELQRPRREHLVDGVKSLTLRYFGEPSSAREPKWHERSADAETLPQLIEVAVALETDELDSGRCCRSGPAAIIAVLLCRDVGVLAFASRHTIRPQRDDLELPDLPGIL